MGAATGALAQAPTCNQAPGPGCLYFPAASYGFTPFERSTFYTDTAGDQREVQVLIRQPLGAPAPMPVVIWSHGGADGKSSPATSMVEWSETTARAGYLRSASPTRTANRTSRRRLCNVIGIADDATCTVFKYLNWDRPHDIRAVLDELERLAAGEFRGQIDMQRVAVGGHSAGAGGAQTVAGAQAHLRRRAGRALRPAADRVPRLLAAATRQRRLLRHALSASRATRGPTCSARCSPPPVTATAPATPAPSPGSCIGDTPFGRRIGFQRMPASGNKYHLYLHDADAFHTLFQLNAGKCAELGVDQAQVRRDRALAVVGRARVSRRACAAVAGGLAVAAKQSHRSWPAAASPSGSASESEVVQSRERSRSPTRRPNPKEYFQ